MSKARLMTGALAGLMLLTSGAAIAQLRNGYEQQSDTDDAYPDNHQHSGHQHSGQDELDDHSPQDDTTQPPRAEDDFSDVAPPDQDRSSARANDPEADAVIDSCAIAAREEAERDGGYAEVRQVQDPRETRQGYTVDGDVEVRTSWRAQGVQTRHFTCSVENGRISDIYFQGQRAKR